MASTSVPVSLLGRLAVDQSTKGQGLGEHLLLNALQRSLAHASQIAAMALVVEAKDENAAGPAQQIVRTDASGGAAPGVASDGVHRQHNRLSGDDLQQALKTTGGRRQACAFGVV